MKAISIGNTVRLFIWISIAGILLVTIFWGVGALMLYACGWCLGALTIMGATLAQSQLNAKAKGDPS